MQQLIDYNVDAISGRRRSVDMMDLATKIYQNDVEVTAYILSLVRTYDAQVTRPKI